MSPGGTSLLWPPPQAITPCLSASLIQHLWNHVQCPATKPLPVPANPTIFSQPGAPMFRSYWRGRWNSIRTPCCDKTLSRDLLRLRCRKAKGFLPAMPEVNVTLSESIKYFGACILKCSFCTFQTLKYYCKCFYQYQMYKKCKGLWIPNVSEVRESFKAVGSGLSLSLEQCLQHGAVLHRCSGTLEKSHSSL